MPTGAERPGPVDRRVLAAGPGLRAHLVRCGALAGVLAVAVLVQAEAVGRLLPRLIDGRGSAVAPLAAWLVVAAALRGASAAGAERSASRAMASVRAAVRTEVLDAAALLRVDRRRDLGPAEAEGLVGAGVDALDPWARSYVPALAAAAVVPLVAGLRIAGADLTSAIILALVAPLVPVFMVLIGWAAEASSARRWDALQRLSARFLDTLTGMATLRLFGRAQAQVERVREVTDRYRAATVRTLRVAFLSALVLELLATLSVAIVAVSLGARLAHGSVGLSEALVVLLLAPEVLLPLRRVGAAFHASTSGVDAAVELAAVRALPLRPHGSAELAGGADHGAPVGSAASGLVVDGLSLVDERRGVRLAPTSLRVAPGELVAVTGPSGSGKSTLVDLVRGALAPSAGEVRWEGVDVGSSTPRARARRFAWVPQRPRPIGATVAASVALGSGTGSFASAPASAASASAVGSVAEVLGALDLTALAERAPDGLSGGEGRRVAVARAIVAARGGEVGLVLADEPTAQLDVDRAAAVRELLAAAARSGIAVLIATHDPALVALADREVVLAAGAPGDEPVDGDETFDGDEALGGADGSPAAPVPAGHGGHPPVPALARSVVELDPLHGPPDGPSAGAAPAPLSSEDRPGTFRWATRLARPRRARLLAAVALGVMAEASTVGLAATAAWLIVRAAEHPSFADLAVAAVAVRACGIGKGVFRYGERLVAHDATLRLLADLRATVVGRLAHLAPTGMPERGRGELLQRLVADVDRVQDLFLRVAGPAASAWVVAAGAIVLAEVLVPSAGLVLLLAALVVGVALPVAVYRVAREDEAAAASLRGRLAALVVAHVDHVEEAVAVGASVGERAAIEAVAEDQERGRRRRTRRDAVAAAIAAAAPGLTAAAVVAVAGPARAGLSGPVLGVVVLLPLAVLELLGPLVGLGPVAAATEAAAARVRDLLGRPDPVEEPADPAAPPEGRGLRFDRAALAWPGGPVVVADLDLLVEEGARVALVGPSGSGKSTVAAAAVRFLDPVRGEASVGDVAMPALGGDGVRRLVTWCPQDPWFADTTLADGLRLARPDATDDQLWAALDTVHLGAWARALPDGLATRLARDAEEASGGQRQRLGVARAVLGGQRVVVLDEPTSHLDPATATAVRHDVLDALADRSVLLLAHEDPDGIDAVVALPAASAVSGHG